jgi:hypothetical protein
MVIKVDIFFSIRKTFGMEKWILRKTSPFFWLIGTSICSPHDTGLSEHKGTSKSCGFIIILCIHRWQVVGKSPFQTYPNIMSQLHPLIPPQIPPLWLE